MAGKKKQREDTEPTPPTIVQPAAGSAQGEGSSTPRIAVSEHPRAARFVRQAREAAGLGGFLLAGWMSLSTHTLADTLLRALIAGVACQLIVWAAAVLLCRHLIVAEIRSREDALMQVLASRRDAAAKRAGAPIEGRGATATGAAGGRRESRS